MTEEKLKGMLQLTFVDVHLLEGLLGNNQIFDDLATARVLMCTSGARDWEQGYAGFTLLEETLGNPIMRGKYPRVLRYQHGVMYPAVHMPIPSEKGNSYYYAGKLEKLSSILEDFDAEIRHDENALAAFEERKKEDLRHDYIRANMAIGGLTFQSDIQEKEGALAFLKARRKRVEDFFADVNKRVQDPHYIFHQGFGLMDVSADTMTATRFFLVGSRSETIEYMQTINQNDGRIPRDTFTDFDPTSKKYMIIDSERAGAPEIQELLTRPNFYPLQGKQKAQVGADSDMFDRIVQSE